MHSIGTWWMWVGFFGFVGIMLFVDMFLLGNKNTHRVSTREALSWSIIWVSFALLFNLLLWWYLSDTQSYPIANEKALEFLTGYLIEKSLSMDNLFVFLMIFHYFAIPAEYQKRVLIFGLLGAFFLRLIMILFGVILVSKFHAILYLFGLFLLITGIKMLIFAEKEVDLDNNLVLTWMKKHLRVTDRLYDEKFFVRQNKLLYVTPLFLVLVLIEISDIIFAVDSIPAIFAITEDPFIVFTSNIFAILGLRAMYFLLAHLMERFTLLKYGFAIILSFIGTKMLIAYWVKIPTYVSLVVVAAVLATCVVLSLTVYAKKQRINKL